MNGEWGLSSHLTYNVFVETLNVAQSISFAEKIRLALNKSDFKNIQNYTYRKMLHWNNYNNKVLLNATRYCTKLEIRSVERHICPISKSTMAWCITHARNGHISASDIKSDVTIVFLDPDFLQDAKFSAVWP